MTVDCVYCGVNPGLTRDHIPLKSFIRKPYPDNLLTVPACHECNNGYSKDEERFRLFIGGLCCHSPEADELFDGPISRSMDRNPRLKNEMFGALGVGDGRVYFEYDPWSINRVAVKIARGLEFVEVGIPFSRAQVFDVDMFEVGEGNNVTKFGPDFTYEQLEEGVGGWEFTFYESMRFRVVPRLMWHWPCKWIRRWI